MTYYETNAGAKVFAAGAFSLAGSDSPASRRSSALNLWERLGRDTPALPRMVTAARVATAPAEQLNEWLRLPTPLPNRHVVVPILMYHRINVARSLGAGRSRAA